MIPKQLLLLLAGVATAAVARPKPSLPPGPPAPTARDVTEMQLDARDGRPARLSGAEARKIHERYLGSIGRMLDTDRISAGNTSR